MKTSEQPSPSFEEFGVLCRTEFSFLTQFGFQEVPLPSRPFINPFQTRFSNGKVIIVVEGISYGFGADVHLEDLDGVRVPLILFVPTDQRPARKKRPPPSNQRSEIVVAASRVKQFCTDLLAGDMNRFYERAAAWKHYLDPTAPKGTPRRLP